MDSGVGVIHVLVGRGGDGNPWTLEREGWV